jgi:Trypsin-co-occurring domain 1
MAEYTRFTLPSGAAVLVQSSLSPPSLVVGGVEQASGLGDKARETWEDGVELVRELAQGIVAKLKQATSAADGVEVEFGVNISGKSGIILVEGNVAANLKVTITWKGGETGGQAARA